ncbi:hypothetical protein DFH06DRAFT_1150092 [Mycena polygramma]|nr:hypothetical protein DFH06DRAFT_1150092 [Mycena polygramma]
MSAKWIARPEMTRLPESPWVKPKGYGNEGAKLSRGGMRTGKRECGAGHESFLLSSPLVLDASPVRHPTTKELQWASFGDKALDLSLAYSKAIPRVGAFAWYLSLRLLGLDSPADKLRYLAHSPRDTCTTCPSFDIVLPIILRMLDSESRPKGPVTYRLVPLHASRFASPYLGFYNQAIGTSHDQSQRSVLATRPNQRELVRFGLGSSTGSMHFLWSLVARRIIICLHAGCEPTSFKFNCPNRIVRRGNSSPNILSVPIEQRWNAPVLSSKLPRFQTGARSIRAWVMDSAWRERETHSELEVRHLS